MMFGYLREIEGEREGDNLNFFWDVSIPPKLFSVVDGNESIRNAKSIVKFKVIGKCNSCACLLCGPRRRQRGIVL